MPIVCIDLGNSLSKIGFFDEQQLQRVEHYTLSDLMNNSELKNRLSKYDGFVCSVLSAQQNNQLQRLFERFVFFDLSHQLPITLNYATPHTLGKDRICNVVGAWSKNPCGNSLIIDIGTCLKFDIVSKDGIYHGGSIAPGIRLRYQSLHDYTDNLPLFSATQSKTLIGSSTQECIESGVINGMKAEIEYFISKYSLLFKDLTIFITGGDAQHFDLVVKNNIFATADLTLIGLHEIFSLNAK